METPPDTPAPTGGARQDPLDQAFRELLSPICTALGRIEKTLDGRCSGDDGERNARQNAAPAPLATDAAAEILRRMDALQTALCDLGERVTLALDPQPPETSDFPEASAADTHGDPPDQWHHILLDDELAADPSLADSRRQFLQDVFDGLPAARALAGHLMIVRAASQQDLPEMLRHVGEAYYRWRPREAGTAEEPFETALAQWLNQLVRRAGLPNSIQLVQPGERFDSARHIAAGRGVQIVAVRGWVVLRDRTKVYTRANVTVR